MTFRFRFPLRHPFHPELTATPVRLAGGVCPVLSGTFNELLRASRRGLRASKAVFALCYPDYPFIEDSERDALWQAFKVPVFTILLDRAGRLLAYECEAQDGLHVAEERCDDMQRESLETTPCECGRPGERLKPSVIPCLGRPEWRDVGVEHDHQSDQGCQQDAVTHRESEQQGLVLALH